MARSANDRLASIRSKIERAEKQRQKAEEEFEQLIQPLKRKLVTVAEAAADTFVRENIEEMDNLNLSRSEQRTLEARITELFAEALATSSNESTDEDDETEAPRQPTATPRTTDLDQELSGGM